MNIKGVWQHLWANKGHLWNVGGTATSELTEALEDGKITPEEGVDAAEAVVLDALEEFGQSNDVLVEVPLSAYNQSALIHAAIEDIRSEAVMYLSDRKLTKKEATKLAAFAARRILRAIPAKEASHE